MLRIALTLAALAWTGSASAQMPVWMGTTSQGSQTLIRKPVQSWKAMKFDHVVKQETDFSCGAAALATIFNHAYGKRTTERQVLVNMMKLADPDVVRDKGFSLLDMKRYVGAVGMKAEGYKVPFDALGDLKVPAIALINTKGYKHFVVIRKTTGDIVQLADPALGNRLMSRRDFEKSWNGVVFVVLGKGYHANSALKNPPPPLSARRLYDLRSPLPNAEASDFANQSTTSFAF